MTKYTTPCFALALVLSCLLFRTLRLQMLSCRGFVCVSSARTCMGGRSHGCKVGMSAPLRHPMCFGMAAARAQGIALPTNRPRQRRPQLTGRVRPSGGPHDILGIPVLTNLEMVPTISQFFGEEGVLGKVGWIVVVYMHGLRFCCERMRSCADPIKGLWPHRQSKTVKPLQLRACVVLTCSHRSNVVSMGHVNRRGRGRVHVSRNDV